jgi:hypothetical protein
MGLKLGMDRQTVLRTTYGEFFDLLACDSISKGDSKQKLRPEQMAFDDFVALR